MSTVISVEHLSKSYRLGQIGTGTFAHDLSVWWARMRGKPNPMLRIGESERLPSPRRPSPVGRGDGGEGDLLWALKDVSFTVEQGEVLGIIGRNGAGKSTLLKILSRVTAPTSGRVKVKGRVASLLEVGTGFHPELTGRENVYLNGAILGMSKAEVTRKFDEIVDFSGVEQFIDTPVKRYSSGMYVRLAFAVAAHLEPEILVVDEVLAVGDAEFQKKCLGKMGEVAHAGRTVLFVSHNMAAITSLCSRAMYIKNGEFITSGISSDVVQTYLSNLDESDSLNRITLSERKGSGLVRLVDMHIKNAKNESINAIVSGQDVVICLDYLITQGRRVDNGVCILIFKTLLGQPLFSCSTRLYNYFPFTSGGKLYCQITNFPLNQGQYYVDVLLKKGSDSYDILDAVEGVIRFSVIAGDFFGTGRIVNVDSSPFLVSHSWSTDESAH